MGEGFHHRFRNYCLGACWLMGMTAMAQHISLAQYDSIVASSLSITEKAKILDDRLSSTVPFDSLERATLWYEYAKWNWTKTKDKSKAVKSGKRAHTLLTQMAQTDTELLKKNLYNLGHFHRLLEYPDYPSALFYLDTLVAISEPLDPRVGKAYKEQGDIYDKLGDFQRALDHYTQAEQIHTKNEDLSRLLITYLNESATYANLRDPQYAQPFFTVQQHLEQLAKILPLSQGQYTRYLMNTGVMYETVGDFDRSHAAYLKALALAEEAGDTASIFGILNNLGVLMKQQGHFEEALQYHQQSSAYAGDHLLFQSTLENNLGEVWLAQGNFEKANDQYNKAIAIRLGGSPTGKFGLPSVATIEQSPFKRDILDFLIDKTRALGQYYEQNKQPDILEEAAATMELADAVIDMLYFESREDLSKLFWRKKGAELYLQAVSICNAMNDLEKAFYYMEKNKGLLLLENITAAKAREYAQLPDSIIDREYQLMSRIHEWETKLSSEATITPTMEAALFEQKQAYKQFIDSLETSYPAYYHFKQQLSVISPKQVQETLKHNERVITYIMGKKQGYVMIISSEGMELSTISLDEHFDESLAGFQELLTRPLVSEADLQAYKTYGHELLKLLGLHPVVGNQTFLKLVIVPDGPLQQLPFEALVMHPMRDFPAAFLISNAEISYRYSLSVGQESAHLKVQNTDGSSAFVLSNFKDAYLPPLVRGDEEVVALGEVFTEVFTSNKATKETFLKYYNQSNSIHISTHGGVEDGVPWLGFYDASLTLDELYFLRNSKELIVLSACKTSLGNYREGEGTFNLTRGFINSGAKSVLATLWDLNEKSGQEITQTFYVQLKKGKSKSEALRMAKLDYLNNHVNTSNISPYYWSALILTGDPQALPTGNSSLYIFLFLCIVGLAFFIFKMKKR